MYRRLLRPALFRLGGGDAETAHEATVRALGSLVSGSPGQLALWAAAARYRRLALANARTVFGIRFPNPVGLAAGLDKDGRALPAWPALGFGFVEVGTVTRRAQPGNPSPRLYRLPASGALVNRMGFNNAGAAALAERLRTCGRTGVDGRYRPLAVPLGISLGKSKATPLDSAVDDYLASLRVLYHYGDYFAINVSSPNTEGLRSLQQREQLAGLLGALVAEARGLAGDEPPRPLLVKVSPDLSESALTELLSVCLEQGVAGIVATNTTLSRDGVAPSDHRAAAQPGGLSGGPLHDRAVRMVRFVHRETAGALPVVGVGGIGSAGDALRMFDAGASLVQLYTGFVYQGPELVRQINRALWQTVPAAGEATPGHA